MEKLFSRYHRNYSFDIEKSKSAVIGYVSKQKNKKRNYLDRLVNVPLDFNDIIVACPDTMEMIVRPTNLQPYKANGRIKIKLADDLESAGTRIQAEIIPYFKSTIYGAYLIIFFLMSLTALGLILGINIFATIGFFLFSTIFLLIIHLQIVRSRVQLKGGLDELVNDLNKKATPHF